MSNTFFHGSYQPNDVRFLLKPLKQADNLPALEKEQAIQSGQRHYSEMLTPESLPSPEYMRLFKQAVAANGQRMAKDCVALAHNIHQQHQQIDTPILVSLARAGTPVGVLLKHLLTDLKQEDVPHYSISIIRDRGIDTNAINFILQQHKTDGSNLVFVDGWTGKGVITRELTKAVHDYNQKHNTNILPHLYVLSDLAGVAWQSASFADYLIPSAILNSTVSGLVSRSILDKQIMADDFHGCLFYEAFLPQDCSQQFVQKILQLASSMQIKASDIRVPDAQDKQHQQTQMADFVHAISNEFAIDDINLIKPGIGEATRVLLRRVPEQLLVKNKQDVEVQHLLVLAKEKGVAISERPQLPFKALSLIKAAK